MSIIKISTRVMLLKTFCTDYVILKNRKSIGSLQYHRIQQRGEKQKKPQKLIEELDSSTKTVKPPLRPASETPGGVDTPKFRIVRHPPEGDPEFLVAQVFVKDITTGKNLLLDVGEDRLILSYEKKPGTLLDIFLPYSVDEKSTVAHFNQFSKILSVIMPVLKAACSSL